MCFKDTFVFFTETCLKGGPSGKLPNELFKDLLKNNLHAVFLWVWLLMLTYPVYSQTSYTWNGSVSNAWTNTSNWTPNTGFPGASDHVVVVAGTPNSLVLDINRNIINFTITGGTFDLNGLSLTINGNTTFSAGTINYGSITVPSATSATLGASTGSMIFGASLNLISSTLTVRNTTFNNTVSLRKTGASNDSWVGNNTFQQAATIHLSGSGYIRHANSTRDIFNGDLTLKNTGTGILNMAYNGSTGTQFNGNLILENSNTGGIRFGQSTGTCTLANTKTISIGGAGYSSSGGLYLRRFTQIGTTAQTFTLGGTARLYLQTGTVFNANVQFTAPRLFINGATYNGTAQLTKSGASADAGSGGNIFQQDLTLTNLGSGYLQLNGTGNDVYNGNVIISSTAAGGIRFGQGTGTCTLASGKSISIGAGGFSSTGYFYLRNFKQLGTATQTLVLTGTTRFYLQVGCVFNGPVSFTAPQMFLNGATFNNTALLQKSGASNNVGIGGNVFQQDVTIVNSGTGYFQSNSTGNDSFNGNLILSNTNTGGIRLGQSTGTNTLANTKTISIGAGGYSSSGPLYIRNFNQIGGTAQTLVMTGTAPLYLQSGVTFNGNVNFTASQIFLNGSKYLGTAIFQKTGATDNAGTGGNRFYQDVTFTNSGAGFLQTNGAANDTFNGNITVNSTAAGGIRFGQGAGFCYLDASKTISIGAGGFSSSGGLYLRRFIQSGAIPLTLTLSGTSRLHLESGTQFLGDVNFSAPQIYLNGATYFGLATIQKTGATGNPGTGGNIFHQNLTLTNSGSGYLQLNGAGNDTFYQNVIINNTSSGGIRFGQNAGICWLASGKTITIGAGGYSSSGALYLRNFRQQGSTPQNLNLSGTAAFYLQTGSIFNADVDFRAAQMYLNGARYKGISLLEKKGSGTNSSTGGNIFDSTVTIRNISTGTFRLCNNSPDTFYGNATFVQTGSGALQPCYSFNSVFYRNISTNGTTTAITFGANTGIVVLQGNYLQSLEGSASRIPVFRRLTLAKDSFFQLNVPLNISIALTLNTGKIISSITNKITLTSTATTTIGNASSYVNGPMVRTQAAVGPVALHFPIGSNLQWSPAVLTATHSSTTSATYQAMVVEASPASLGYTNPMTIANVSTIRYWQFARQNVANFTSGTMQLYYQSDDSVADPSNLRIVKNNNPVSTQWYDIGGSGTGAPTGSITSSGSPTAFNSFPSTSSNIFALGNVVGGSNPLPVNLVSFKASCNQNQIELKWTTASEVNNKMFRIWYASNQRPFALIDSIEGAGNSSNIMSYSFIHNPENEEGHYYRLEQVDFDGKNTIFDPIFAPCTLSKEGVKLFPNPANQSLNIESDIAVQPYQIQDMFGRVLLTHILNAGNNTITVSELKSGYYNLVYYRNGTLNYQSFIIAR